MKRSISLTIALIMTFTLLYIAPLNSYAASGDVVTVSEGTKYTFPNGMWETSMNVSNGMVSYCIDYNVTFVAGQAVTHDAHEYFSQDDLNWLYCASVLSASDVRVFQIMIWKYLNGIHSGTIQSMEAQADALYQNSKAQKDNYIGNGYVYEMTNGAQRSMSFFGSTAGKITLIKKSSVTTSYSLSGAIYEVFSDSSCTKKVGTLTTKADGTTNTLKVSTGTYYVKEKTAPAHFDIDKNVYTTNVTTGKTITVTSTDAPHGKLKLKKSANDPTGITINNPCYSLKGAVYEVFSNPACTTKVGTLTTDASGNTNELELSAGTYYIKEKTAPKGYFLDPRIFTVKVSAGKTTTFETSDRPQNDPVDIQLFKVDKETGTNITVNDGSLEGAEFTYNYYTNYDCSGTPTRSWTFKTDENGYIQVLEQDVQGIEKYMVKDKCDDFYLSIAGKITFPLGSVSVQETKAPEGYEIDDTIYKFFIKPSDNIPLIVKPDGTLQDPLLEIPIHSILPNQITRHDIKFEKKASDTDLPMGGVEFSITCKETGETHDIKLDENGFWSSENTYRLHSFETNLGRETSGTWFGFDDEIGELPVNDELGAFAFGTYIFKEKQTIENKMYKLIEFEVVIDVNSPDVIDAAEYLLNKGSNLTIPREQVKVSHLHNKKELAS